MINDIKRGLFLLALRGQNVYTYRGAFELNLDSQGLVYVTGTNLDTQEPSSSGAGKSRLFSLIPRLLYGREFLGKEPVGDMWAPDGSPGHVELEYWSDGTFYLVRESFNKKSSLSFFSRSAPNEEWQPIGAKNKKAGPSGLQAEISASVARPLDEFLGTVVWKQGHGHVLIQGKPSERIAWLSSLFGLTKYDLIHEELQAQHKTARDEQAKFLPYLGARDQACSLLASLGDVSVLEAEHTRISAESSSLGAQLSQMTSESIELRASLTKVTASLASRKRLAGLGFSPESLVATVTQYEKETADLELNRQELVSLTQSIASYNSCLPTLQAYRALPENMRDRSVLESKQRDLQSSILSLRSSIATLVQRRNQITSGLSVRTSSADVLRNLLGGLVRDYGLDQATLATVESANALYSLKYDECIKAHGEKSGLELQLDGLKTASSMGGTCPYCGHAVDSAHAQVELDRLSPSLPLLAARADALSKLLSVLSDYITKYRAFTQLPVYTDTDLTQVDDEHRQATLSLASSESDLADVCRALQVILSFESKSALLSFDLTAGQSRAQDLQLLVDKKTVLRNTLATLTPYLSLDLSGTETDVARIEADLLECSGRITSITDDRTRLVSEQAVIQHKLDQVRNITIEIDRLSALCDKHASLVRREGLLKSLVLAYDKKGFKKAKLRRLLELIKLKLPVWTAILFTENNFSVDVDGDEGQLNLVVRQVSDPTGTGNFEEKLYDVSSVSGGEESKLAICIMLTLIDIVAEERKCNVLILDEVDRHMDKNGLRLMSDVLIPNLAARRSSIYMVSHQIPISSDFDKELVVTKRRACSTLSIRNLHS